MKKQSKHKKLKIMSTHVAYFFQEWTDIDENTSQSMQDYVTGGYESGETEGNKWIGRELAPNETVTTAPEMIVSGNPIPKTGYTAPTPPFKPW